MVGDAFSRLLMPGDTESYVAPYGHIVCPPGSTIPISESVNLNVCSDHGRKAKSSLSLLRHMPRRNKDVLLLLVKTNILNLRALGK
ncbi:hypothetical protein E2C01_030744 [Portunus trituberculatus]|uniref:Uncharacterized protein n=1 Tax=Portunus trituberculatus TaxID=210409 RepID=A0A5B7ER86_PORTR|nr:hypothetical protein [Portunus trituberculatus]